MRKTLGALLLWSALTYAISPVAHADARAGFVIEGWEVPATCGAQEEFSEAVVAAVGPWPKGAPVVRVTIAASSVKRGYSLLLTTESESGSGRRTLEARSCEELLDTAAVVLSLALDAEVLYRNERTHTVVVPGPVPPKKREQAVDDEVPGFRDRPDFPESSLSRRGRREPRAEVRVTAVTDVGTLPRTALGAAITLGTRVGAYRIAVQLARWGRQDLVLAPDLGARFDFLSGRVRLCRQLPRARPVSALFVAVDGCVLAHMGRLSSEGLVPEPETSANVLLGFGAEIALVLPYQVRIAAALSSHQSRPRYRASQDGRAGEPEIVHEVHQPSMLAIQLGFGWGLTF